MYSPCFECLNKYNKEYSKACDTTCDYAAAIKTIDKLLDEISDLQNRVDDLEQQIECHNDW